MNKNRHIRFGIVLILLSGVAFGLMLLIPFLNLGNRQKVIGTSAAFISMEILFWAGGLLVGKELFQKYKSWFNPKRWFNRNNEPDK